MAAVVVVVDSTLAAAEWAVACREDEEDRASTLVEEMS